MNSMSESSQNNTKNGKLLPCPLCGGEAKVCEGGINGKMRVYGLVEHKDGCFFLADGLPTKYQHIMESDFDAWNTRAAYEMDGWFYLPKPKEQLIDYTTGFTFDDLSLKATATVDAYALVDAVRKWQEEELNKHIVERICEVFKPDRTCKQVLTDCNDGLMPPFTAHCSACSAEWGFTPNYCPNCGARVTPKNSETTPKAVVE